MRLFYQQVEISHDSQMRLRIKFGRYRSSLEERNRGQQILGSMKDLAQNLKLQLMQKPYA